VILGFFLLLGLANWWLHAKEQYNGPVIETWEGREAEPARIAIPSQPKNMNEGIAWVECIIQVVIFCAADGCYRV
jgi:choline transport protein